MPAISVVVPVYKVEPYLRRCVDSILAQTFTDFELILVDDGSPDNCPAICDEYAKKDSRVHVIHQKNGGLSSARNSGLGIARGKFALFCDSDDYVSPRWCEALINAAPKREDSFVFGGINTVVRDEKRLNRPCGQLQRYTVDAFLELHSEGIVGFAWNVLFSMNIIREHGLKFRNDVIIEDLPFCLEYLNYVHSLVFCGDSGYYYVQYDTTTLSKKYYQDGFRKWREKYSAIQEFIDRCVPIRKQNIYRAVIANKYLYAFLRSLENTFDPRNDLSFVQKLKYNQSVINSPEFKHCLQYSDGKNENQRYLKLLKGGNYYVAYLYIFGAKIKNLLKERMKCVIGG